jgi:hypothetical protein
MFVIECERGGENGWVMRVERRGSCFLEFTKELSKAYLLADINVANAVVMMGEMGHRFVPGLTDLTIVELQDATKN